ncbi:hypothetical protein AB0M02_00245 [Actinoplanes sp. NPDC051861]
MIDPMFGLISLAAFGYAAYQLVMERREQRRALALIPRPREAS